MIKIEVFDDPLGMVTCLALILLFVLCVVT
jgi:hypothetical protein